jgi:Phytanoyl-CoA dioxygenase (PhyH)
MPMDKTAAAEALLDDGYRVIPSFLDATDLRLLTQDVEVLLSSPRGASMCRPGLIPLRWNDAIVARILQPARPARVLRDALRARDLKWLSGYVSTRASHTPALWWHQDWWCWDHPISFRRPATQVAVLCYLTDTDVQSGALRVLAGSHRASTAAHGLLPEAHGKLADGLPRDHAALADLPGQRTLAVRAGDAVVLDYRLLHGTHANATSRRRDCILLSFIPAWSELPREMQAHLIAHLALPDHAESTSRAASAYDDLLPRFEGTPASLRLNRVPPTTFTVGD